jgi:putative transposase
MPAHIIAAVRTIVVSTARRCGRVIKHWLRPAQLVTAGAAGIARDATMTRSELLADSALLRQQLIVLRRSAKRPALGQADRLLMVILARLCTTWRDAVHVVQPDTVLRWHRDLFKLFWRHKSRPNTRSRRLPIATVDLIKAMALSNVTWGSERIRGELLKLGIRVSKRTVQKYLRQVRPPRTSGQTWTTFIKNHTDEIWACDFLRPLRRLVQADLRILHH